MLGTVGACFIGLVGGGGPHGSCERVLENARWNPPAGTNFQAGWLLGFGMVWWGEWACEANCF